MSAPPRYLPQFKKLLHLFRESPEHSPRIESTSNLKFKRKPKLSEYELNGKAEKLIAALQENTIRVLDDVEFNRHLMKGTDSQHKFFIPKEETFSSNFPLLAVRNLVRKNEFIKYPWLTSTTTVLMPKKRRKIQTKSTTVAEKQQEEFLQIHYPPTLSTKAKIFEDKTPAIDNHRSYCLSKKRGSLPSHISLQSPSQTIHHENLVKRHAEGFKNKANRDFFEHVFRLYLKNQALLKNSEATSPFRGFTMLNSPFSRKTPLNSPYFTGNHTKNLQDMDNLLKIKDLVLNKAIIDLKTYQKIIDRYLKTKDQAVGPYEPLPGIKNTLKPLSINPDYLKLPNQQRLFHEEVFILNILEKASSLGLKSLTQSEISLFQDIIAHRKAQMESVDREIEGLIIEKERGHRKFATLINATAETDYSLMGGNYEEKTGYAGKRTQSTGNLALIPDSDLLKTEVSEFWRNFSEPKEDDPDVIHKNKGTIVRRKEKLRPLTMSPSDNNEGSNILFGNMELEELNYRLNAVKAQLFERMDLGQIKGEQEGSDFLEAGRNKKHRESIKKLSFVNKTSEEPQKKEALVPPSKKKEAPLKAFFDFGGLSSKLREKSLHLKDISNIENPPKKELKDLEVKLSEISQEEIIEEESPKDSQVWSKASSQISISGKEKRSSHFAMSTRKSIENDLEIPDNIQEKQDHITNDHKYLNEHYTIGLKMRRSIEPQTLHEIPKDHKKSLNINIETVSGDQKLMELRERIKEKNNSILERLKKSQEIPLENLEIIEKPNSKIPIIPNSLERKSRKPTLPADSLTIKPPQNSRPSKQETPIFEGSLENIPSIINEIKESSSNKLVSNEEVTPLIIEPQPKRSSIKKFMRKSQAVTRISTFKGKKLSAISPIQPHNFTNDPVSPTPNTVGVRGSIPIPELSGTVKIMLNNQTILSHKLTGKDQLKQLFTVKPQEQSPNLEGGSLGTSENSVGSKNTPLNINREKTSSFSKAAKRKLRKKNKGSQENVEGNESPEIDFGEENLNFRKINTIEDEIMGDTQEIAKSMNEEELDRLLQQDMAHLDKKAMRVQMYKAKNSTTNLQSLQNSAESFTPKNQDIKNKKSMKDPIDTEIKPTSKSSSRNPSINLNEHELSRNLSISSDEKYKNETWAKDPFLEINTKPLRLSTLNENVGSATQKNQVPFWEEGNEKEKKNNILLPINNINTNSQINPSRRPSILKQKSPMASPSSTMFKYDFPKLKSNEGEDAFPKMDYLKVDDAKDEKFYMNSTPYLKKLSKKLPSENDSDNPYAKLKGLGGEDNLALRKKTDSPSKAKLESMNSSFSDEMDLNDLIKYELKKTENFKLGDLKQGIEENISKMQEDGEGLDTEGKFNIMLYQNRKEQMQRYIEMATDSHQSWLTQPDCLDQLKAFLSEKNRFFNDYEKNNGLKFCAPIQIPKNDAMQVFNELTKHNSVVINPSDHEKMMEYLMKINEEVFNEKERKKKFKIEQDMMNVLKKYLKNFKSVVKQGNIKQNSESKVSFEREAGFGEVRRKKKKLMKEKIIGTKDTLLENSKNSAKDDVKFMTLATKLKYLREKDSEKFLNVMKKCQSIKKTEYAYY